MLIDLSCSPYLTSLAARFPELVERSAAESFATLIEAECFHLESPTSQEALMRQLRIAKNKLALLVAMADISNTWTLEEVTKALSDFADYALSQTMDFLLRDAAKRGEITLPHPENPCAESGIIVLGMGKLGGFELNYSSDIDLIIFFERDRLAYSGKSSEQKFMNKLAQDIVSIMQERTMDGYVFRTDLRLRPDPASTPPAISVGAAYHYYESVGQNWERAAMIKARPVAGEIAAGEQFLKGLTPYLWRRNLDFAAINDIHSIKRQMDARNQRTIQIAGHNIKLGLGGIREIEFYVQIHQLIWGGRKPGLRVRNTCETLGLLVTEGLVDADKAKILTDAYHFHRMVEHRLQMVHDAQTHTLPENAEELVNIARFCGFGNKPSTLEGEGWVGGGGNSAQTATTPPLTPPSRGGELEAFETRLLHHLHSVHDIYAASFKSEGDLGDEGNLVFTGVSSDPETVKTLTQMGYREAERVSEIIMGWHHGSKRCTRTKRARELLTELMPSLLKRLSETANPDAAFVKFDEFLGSLPAGVQLFSLFQANKDLLGLIADIMGSAPALAEYLSKSPQLIENVLFDDFYNKLPEKKQLDELANERISFAQDVEEVLDHLTYFRNEMQFRAGVHFLKDMVDAKALGDFLTDLAQAMVQAALAAIQKEFEAIYGRIEGAEFAVIALGKAGSRELTFHSDLDLVFIYRVDDFEKLSDGDKQHNGSVYYNRLAQRLVNALSQLNRGGKLYEVDTRLRPSGRQGLLAVSDKALSHYFSELAWTFEYMAFTKARVIAGDAALAETLTGFIHVQITKPRDKAKLKTDVHDMRMRMEEGHGSDNIWNIKHVRGGMVDIDFIAQYLLLLHAPDQHDAPVGSSETILQWLRKKALVEQSTLDDLLTANRFLNQIFNLLRLCIGDVNSERDVPPGLKKLLCTIAREPDFDTLKQTLSRLEENVHKIYVEIIAR